MIKKRNIKIIACITAIAIVGSVNQPVKALCLQNSLTGNDLINNCTIAVNENNQFKTEAATTSSVDVEAVIGIHDSFYYQFNSDNSTICIISYKGNRTDVSIPGTIHGHQVTKIADKAFYGNADLISVTVPDSVTIIGNESFAECTSMEQISLDANLNSIGQKAFYDCWNLKSLTIPAGVETIEQYLAYGCDNLTTLVINGASEIKTSAFEKCQSLSAVTLNSGIKKIDTYAFACCERITSINLPDSLTSIGFHAFWRCYGIKKITIPEWVGDCDFACCSGLNEVVLSKTASYIDRSTFFNCTYITKVTIGELVKNIGNDSFADSEFLKSITIPSNVTSIDKDAFSGCGSKFVIYCYKKSCALKFAKRHDIKYKILKSGLSSSKLNIKKDCSTFLNFNGATEKVKWTVSSTKLFSVKKCSGKYNYQIKITAKKAGSGTIKATMNGKSYTCKITVL